MHVRSRLEYSSFVLARAEGCSVIHRLTYSPTDGEDPRRGGAFHTART